MRSKRVLTKASEEILPNLPPSALRNASGGLSGRLGTPLGTPSRPFWALLGRPWDALGYSWATLWTLQERKAGAKLGPQSDFLEFTL